MTVGKYEILSSVIDIIKTLQSQVTNGKLSQVREKGSEVQVTCPFHKEGMERRPSCYIREDGIFHCFTCNESGTLDKFISEVKGCSIETAQQWLIDTFGGVYSKPKYKLKDIVLPAVKPKEYLDESVLNTYEPYHPYMTQRRISDEVIKEFQIKYNPKTKSIVFPVRDKYGKLIFTTERSVEGKRFYIEDKKVKPVFLLYNILRNNFREVYITESQINTLVCYSYGKKAVGLFGAGVTDEQIKDLNNTSVTHYILALDPDIAGLKGIFRLYDNLKDKFISVMVLPEGKDIGDLTEEEFNNCPIIDAQEFMKAIPDYYTR